MKTTNSFFWGALVSVIFSLIMMSCVPSVPKVCRYDSPHSDSQECKSYVGSGWNETLAQADCAEVFPAIPGFAGEYSNVACDTETAIGACVTGVGTPEEAETWFYTDDPTVAGIAPSACENFAGGEWRPNGEVVDPDPMGELMQPEVQNALQSDGNVSVTPLDCSAPDATYDCVRQMAADEEFFVFRPLATPPTTGLIFYPGGLVDPRAYAPQARALAQAGYLVAVVPMPALMAFNGINRAQLVMDAFPDINYWLAGGHSLGGYGMATTEGLLGLPGP